MIQVERRSNCLCYTDKVYEYVYLKIKVKNLVL